MTLEEYYCGGSGGGSGSGNKAQPIVAVGTPGGQHIKVHEGVNPVYATLGRRSRLPTTTRTHIHTHRATTTTASWRWPRRR